MSSALTRRDLVQYVFSSANLIVVAGGVHGLVPSPAALRFVDLADHWREATQHYFNVARSRAVGVSYLSARNAAARASLRLLDAAANVPRDVLVKYYVLYECMLFTSFDLDLLESKFDAWCDDLAREAAAFGLTITPFWWTMWSDPNPRINGSKDRSTTDWKEVRPWQIKR